jgi:hypothetical protein
MILSKYVLCVKGEISWIKIYPLVIINFYIINMGITDILTEETVKLIDEVMFQH